ncbi:MAG: DUF4198 domain-containing protein [Deltaproteobacteria bacterium]|nr:DUF4198 domain-containing protein [Deltaproteobacteria bacterium]
MKRISSYLGLALLLSLMASHTFAHFGVILPSDDIVEHKDSKRLTIKVYFMHPFEQKWLTMEKPKVFKVKTGAETIDLLSTLSKRIINGKVSWDTHFTVQRPGDYIFYLEPQPYWEQAEEKFISHYPKVVVNGLGKEKGWDEEVGLPIEIVPLTRPYGLWVGNVFQGLVLANGKPLSHARIEVEYFNEGGKVKAPKEAYINQVIKADINGVFTYAVPKAGWWGFAALSEASYKIEKKWKAVSL